MMRQIFNTALFILLLLLLPATVNAHDFEVDGIYYCVDGSNATVTYRGTTASEYNNEYSGDVAIPATVTYNGSTYSVTSISNNAFYCCSGLASISIPNSVTSIGSRAFCGCSGLAGISIPNSVTSIGDNAFYCCSGLASISIPNSVTSIAQALFFNCRELKSVTIPNSITSIGSEAFSDCIGLTIITIPNSVTTIDCWAFGGCTGLTSIIIPNSVTSIGEGAFGGCSGLTSVTLPESGVSIPNHAFSGCSSLTSIIAPNCSIGYHAFYRCSSLKSATVGNVGDDAFEECDSLTDVVINGSVGERAFMDCQRLRNVTLINTGVIGLYSFSGCYSLKNITIPNTITNIGAYAFGSPCSLTEIYCLALEPPTMYDAFPPYSAILYVPKESVNAYREADFWNRFSNIIGIGSVMPGTEFEVNGIYYNSTSDNTAMVIANPEVESYYSGDVVIPDSVTYEEQVFVVTGIEDNAFNDCYDLTSVVIGDAVETIGVQAFQGCSDLTSLTIGCGVTNIGAKAFNYCNGLKTVTCRGMVPPVMANSNCFSTAAYNRAKLVVPRKALNTYQGADYWYKFSTIDGWGSIGLGDVIADGKINIGDVTALINILLTADGEYNADADMNNNGRLEIADVASLIDYLLNE